MTTTAARNLALGHYGETLAVRHLTQRGMVLLDRNWRCEAGEIDLVLRDGRVLVVCEVKTRSSTERGTPHEAVDEVKLARLQRLGERWRQARGIGPVDIRVDLVAVLRPRKGASVVEHVPGIG